MNTASESLHSVAAERNGYPGVPDAIFQAYADRSAAMAATEHSAYLSEEAAYSSGLLDNQVASIDIQRLQTGRHGVTPKDRARWVEQTVERKLHKVDYKAPFGKQPLQTLIDTPQSQKATMPTHWIIDRAGNQLTTIEATEGPHTLTVYNGRLVAKKLDFSNLARFRDVDGRPRFAPLLDRQPALVPKFTPERAPKRGEAFFTLVGSLTLAYDSVKAWVKKEARGLVAKKPLGKLALR